MIICDINLRIFSYASESLPLSLLLIGELYFLRLLFVFAENAKNDVINKTQEEIEKEMKIKSIITLPSARYETQNRNILNSSNTLRRNDHIEIENNNVVIERVRGPNYHQYVERMRRMEERRKRRIEAQRSNRRQISEWAQF